LGKLEIGEEMIIHLLIGIVVTTAFFLFFNKLKDKEVNLKWWQWAAIMIGFLYAIFVLEVIVGFINEGVPRGALVNGMLTGIPGLIYATLVYRFVLKSLKAT
jgi:hypothetical protein